MKKALTFDIGGTKIYHTIVDENGKIICEVEKYSTPKTLEEIKFIVLSTVKKFESEVDTIGISTAGAVNNENTRVVYRKQLNLENKIVIGHVGRFHFQKNHVFLIDIFNQLHTINDKYHLRLFCVIGGKYG